MIETVQDYSTFTVEAPALEDVRAEHRAIRDAFESATSTQTRLAAVRRWDDLRRRVETWSQLTNLRFEQDTANVACKAARDFRDEIAPKLTALDIAFKRGLLNHPDRADLERELGAHAFELWANDVLTFDPKIEDDLTRESKLASQYTELIASAELEFQGLRHNLAGMVPYLQDPDRDTRHRAQQIRWEFFARNRTSLDEIYDKLVRLRHEMARKLGYPNFTPLAYKRMSRIDYDASHVERFRDAVVAEIVPLGRQILDRRMRRLGIADVRFWDEPVTSPEGNPKPLGDHDWILDRAQATFTAMDGELGSFFKLMVDRRLLDLRNRDTKAAGGFCTYFPTQGVPFIFASFNGTDKDVDVLVHEMGHAFQCWRSRDLQLLDIHSPTAEACEIDSIGLELLALPHAAQFFGSDGERFATERVEDAFVRIPYMVAVDHFQHLVYQSPEASPAERFAMWRSVEERYLPWRNYGDLGHPAQGGFWQSQLHIYVIPFYYIDYALATTCALQLWARSLGDRAGAFGDFAALCGRGGQASFLKLVESANLRSPFDRGVLREIARRAREYVGL